MSKATDTMPPAISAARAPARSVRRARAGWVLLSLLCSAAPAAAVEQIYIWRDPAGAVRFSAIDEPERRAAERADDTGATCTVDESTAVMTTDTLACSSR